VYGSLFDSGGYAPAIQYRLLHISADVPAGRWGGLRCRRHAPEVLASARSTRCRPGRPGRPDPFRVFDSPRIDQRLSISVSTNHVIHRETGIAMRADPTFSA